MRGKGKGKALKKGKSSLLLNPNIPSVEQTPSYYRSIIELNEDKYISRNELDNLQFELEKMFVLVSKRRDEFEEQLKLLTTGKGKPSTSKIKVENTNVKRVVAETKSNKSSKKGNYKPATVGRPKGSQRRTQDADSIDSPTVPKNQPSDVPSRFWESLKPYTADITKEHIKFLEEWAKPDEDIDFKIPPLGTHYTSEWTDRDVREEEKEGSKANDKGRTPGCSSTGGSSGEHERPAKRRKKETEEYEGGDACPFGPLTQRLVSCLLLENIMSPMEDTIDNVPTEADEPKINLIKSLNIGDPVELEKRIRKNLKIAGLLEGSDTEEDDKEDEVLMELKSVRGSLKAIAVHNLEMKHKLLKLAKEEMAKQELRKKLDVVDAALTKFQGKSVAWKEKGWSLSEEDRKQVMHLLSERRKLVKQIEPEESV